MPQRLYKGRVFTVREHAPEITVQTIHMQLDDALSVMKDADELSLHHGRRVSRADVVRRIVAAHYRRRAEERASLLAEDSE